MHKNLQIDHYVQQSPMNKCIYTHMWSQRGAGYAYVSDTTIALLTALPWLPILFLYEPQVHRRDWAGSGGGEIVEGRLGHLCSTKEGDLRLISGGSLSRLAVN